MLSTLTSSDPVKQQQQQQQQQQQHQIVNHRTNLLLASWMETTTADKNNRTVPLSCGDSLDLWNGIMYLPPMVIKIIVALFIMFGLISTLLNVSIFVFLVKTKKWNNQSKRLVMFLFIIFIANSTIGNTW